MRQEWLPRLLAPFFITMFLMFHLLILLRIHCDSSHDDVICSFAKQNCNLIVNRRKLYRVSAVPKRPISVWQKHGEICLYLPTSPKDITIAMDVEIQPGPSLKHLSIFCKFSYDKGHFFIHTYRFIFRDLWQSSFEICSGKKKIFQYT